MKKYRGPMINNIFDGGKREHVSPPQRRAPGVLKSPSKLAKLTLPPSTLRRVQLAKSARSAARKSASRLTRAIGQKKEATRLQRLAKDEAAKQAAMAALWKSRAGAAQWRRQLASLCRTTHTLLLMMMIPQLPNPPSTLHSTACKQRAPSQTRGESC